VHLSKIMIAGVAAPQSALHPAGTGAQQIADLFWWMSGGILVIGIAAYAAMSRPAAEHRRAAGWLIIGGGAIFPAVVLGILLIYSLPLTSQLRAPGDIKIRIAVSGEQWWWRVRYLASSQSEADEALELANEIRLPAGERVEFTLTSPDVIHSFWIPSLGGKVDMIPGRTTTLILEPTRPGVYRGVCAEYCGASHALMHFMVMVMEPSEFAHWFERQMAAAEPAVEPLARQGQQAFLMNGCGACHTIRGTHANGKVGPDLTHVGSRLSLGAAVLPNTAEAFRHWIGHAQQIKPDVKMPSFGMLPAEELMAIATYLRGLE
jgi:cytochrome c oxidase subunit 2